MIVQSQIYRTLSDAGAQHRIAGILSRERFANRSALGRRVCQEFGFTDRRGRLQLSGCLKALSVLEAKSDRIEDFFRVLKSGCRVEFLAFRTADRLARAIAINSVIAWRIMLMTLLGRQVPECDASLMLTDHELHFLRDYAGQYGLSVSADLGEAVRLVAHLGGYRDRKHDLDPGHQIMWQGTTPCPRPLSGIGLALRPEKIRYGKHRKSRCYVN